MLARLAQGVGELLVLGDRLGELALGLEQALLERADPLGGVLEPAAEGDDLFLERLDLLAGARPTRLSYSASRRSCSVATATTSSVGPRSDPTPAFVERSGATPIRRSRRVSLVSCRDLSGAGRLHCAGVTADVTSGDLDARSEAHAMKVWIDQDLCTGDGLCEEIAPDVFTLLDDGLAYVKEGDKVFSDPGGAEGLADVPDGQEDADHRVRRGVPRRVHLHRGRVTPDARVARHSRLADHAQAAAGVGRAGAGSTASSTASQLARRSSA